MGIYKMKDDLYGKVFDIRRFSTHDGNGIRTTVFFKGCNLKCIWCQNPEGIESNDRVLFFENRCVNCGLCKSIDSENLITIKGNKKVFKTNKREDAQKYIDICPVNALAMDSKIYTVKELMKEVKKDEVFFKQGGGVTLSGGEVLMQEKFVISLLKALKGENIHTAIETALFVNKEVLDSILPYLDLIYVDLKLIDDKAHKKYTGASNFIIKENIRKLLTSSARDKVIIRTPMIPKFTDSLDNILGISRFISSIYKDVKYEILNYNPLAASKYHLVDKTYCFKENPKMFSKEEMNSFYELAYLGGVRNLIKE